MSINKIIKIVILISGLALGISARAYVMESSSYRIEKDSVNSGGLDTSTSTNYSLADTIGEAGTGPSGSTNFNIYAGYRQMAETYLTLTAPAGNIALSPDLGGVSGGTANGNGTWTVETDNLAGYTLSIKATSSPALVSETSSFADYTPVAAGTPDYDWGLASANSEFGFSPYNASSQIDKFKNDGGDCAIGANISDGQCWYGLSTSNETIVNRSSYTDTDGEDTKINFRAEIGGLQAAGTYTASMVVTAVSN